MKKFFSSAPGKIFLVILIFLLVGGILYVVRRKGDNGVNGNSGGYDVPQGEDRVLSGNWTGSDATEASRIENVKDYYEQTSNVVKVFDAAEATNVLTEAEVTAQLEERGFNKFPITYEFDMDGNEIENEDDEDEMEANAESQGKHPMYQTIYQTGNGMIWTIYVVNGAVAALPVSYNWESGKTAEVIVSESDQLITYDPDENRYFVTEPLNSAVLLIKVPKVDAETIEKLTAEELDKRW